MVSTEALGAQGAQIYKKIGVNPHHESTRALKTHDILGSKAAQVIDYEVGRNARFFEREFVDDEPVGYPHFFTLSHHDGHFLTYPIDHPHWRMIEGVHPGERDGKARQGFERFEQTVRGSSARLDHDEPVPISHALERRDYAGTVSLWYSHFGAAGSRPPFDRHFYDSGRLYVRLPLSRTWNIGVDVKIAEEGWDGNADFPIVRLLDYFRRISPNTDKLTLQNAPAAYHLTHPFDTGLNFRQFMEVLQNMPADSGLGSNDPIYIQRRHDCGSQRHTLSTVAKEIEIQLVRAQAELDYLLAKKREFAVYLGQGGNSAHWQGTHADAVRLKAHYEMVTMGYMELLNRRINQNGGTLRLYGCSATVNLTRADIFGHTLESVLSQGVLNARSPMETSFRLPGAFFESDTHYPDYECEHCGGTLTGEPRQGTWRTECDHCRHEFNCKAA